ncbi:hypothetical protein V2W45_1228458, partial [Cenococcum geophilum]
HFLSTVKIALQYLKFHGPKEEHLDLDHISYLEKVFKQDCARLNPGNYVPAIIDPTKFDMLVQKSGTRKYLLKLLYQEPPRLPIQNNTSLLYLHSRHRIAAA